MIINIYSREFKTNLKWSPQIIKGKIQLDMHIERRGFLLGLFFCCSNGDYMSCTINPFTAIFNAFENSQVGNMKYQRSKSSLSPLIDEC